MKNKSKKIFLAFITIVFAVQFSNAQQQSQYTQYMFNTISFNSAYTGSREAPSFMLLNRTQWVGIDGAPQTLNFSFHTPLRNKNMGLGIVVTNDKIGPSNEINASANYAYSIFLKKDLKLAFGLSAGIQSLNTDWSMGEFNNPSDPNYQQNINLFKPSFGMGTFLYSKDWYIGISVPNILDTKYFDEGQFSQAKQEPQLYIISGYIFSLNPNLKFKPATLIKAVQGAPLAFDLSANFLINDKYTIGVAGSLENSISFLTGFQINPKILIGYSYDYNTNNIGKYNDGSHEIFIRFELLKTRFISPRFF